MADRHAPRLPDFVGVGPGRTGTTWLDEVLRPHACLPYGVKETDFFNRHYDRGIDWYAAHFRKCGGAKPVGEICGYFPFVEVPMRIKRHMPECRIIVTVRDPIARVYSHYKMMRRYAFTTLGLEEALERDRFLGAASRYGEYLPLWLDTFGPNRVLVAFYDDLRADAQGYVDRIAEFSGIARFELGDRRIREEAVHSFERAPKNSRLARRGRKLRDWLRDRRAKWALGLLDRAGVWAYCFGRGEPYPPLAEDVDARLRARFLPEVEALERLTGRDLTAWKLPRVNRAVGGATASEATQRTVRIAQG